MEARLSGRALSRRHLVGGLAALGGAVLLAACGGTPPAPTAAPVAPTTAPAPAPTTAPAAATKPAAATTTAPAPAPTAAPAATTSDGTLKFGLIPDESAEKVLTRFKVFIPFMEQNMDMKVEATVGTDYTAMVEAMRARKIDIAFYGPFSYVLASDVANATTLVMPATADGAFSTYNSVIITRKDSGITKLDDLKDKSISFADPASTSGHLIPRSILTKFGYDVDKDLKPIFAGGHDASVLAVANGKVDAGATYVDQIERMNQAGVIKKDDLLVLVVSDPIPDGPIAVRKDYDAAIQGKLLAMFEKMPTEIIKEAYGGSGPDRFVKGDDKVYDSLREVAKVLKLDLSKMK